MICFSPPQPWSLRFLRVLVVLCALLGSLAGRAAEAGAKSFDLPAGPAETTLKQFTAQAGVQVAFPTDLVRGITTRSVSGRHTPAVALELLVADTGLIVVRDAESGSFAIRRAVDGRVESPPKKAEARGDSPSVTRAPRGVGGADELVALDPFVVSENDSVGYSANSTLAGTRINTALRDVGASVSIITPEFLADTASTNAGELLSLTTSTEVGGVFGNFAGGDQVNGRPDQAEARESPGNNQRVRGIGAATNTRDFFITDIPFDSYNLSRVTISRGPNSLLFGIGNPAGLIEASTIRPELHRHRTEIGTRFGSYGSYRGTTDINRVLEKGRLGFRIATVNEQNNFQQEPAFDRKRRVFGTLDVVLRKSDRTSWFGRSTVRVSGELGDTQSTPVNVIPPLNDFSIFFQPPDASIDSIPGVTLDPRIKQGSPTYMWAPKVTVDNRASAAAIPQNFTGYYGVPYFVHIPLIYDTPGQVAPGFGSSTNPALAGLAGIMGRVRYTQVPNGRAAIDAIATGKGIAWLSGFSEPSLQDRNIFDYRRRLISGGSNRVEQTLQAGNLAFTQEFFDGRGGVELAYDQQKTRSSRALPFSFGQNGGANGSAGVYIDVSRYLTNDQPNPNLGRPFIQQLGLSDRTESRDREAFRATAFYKWDLENRGKNIFGVPLGNHTITGLFNRQRIDLFSLTYQLGWTSTTRNLNTDVFQEDFSAAYRISPTVIKYVGPSVLGANSMADVRITDPFSAHIPREGETHKVTFFDFTTKQLVTDNLTVRNFLNFGSRSRQVIDSKSLSVKSDFFRDHIVSVFGWRWDNLATYSSAGNGRLPDNTLDVSSTRLRAKPDLDEGVHNFTWSLVGRVPRKLTARLPLGTEIGGYFNRSGNFNPIAVRANLNGQIIAAPAGTTDEYGFLLEFLERRVSLRLNWFHTVQSNSSNNAQGATGMLYNMPDVYIGRHLVAQTQGIPFASIRGAAASGYTSYQQFIDAMMKVLPEPTNSLKRYRFTASGALQTDAIAGLTDTTDLDARGFEAELVGNVTRNLRVSFNVAKQETVVNGSARLTKEVADATLANLTKLNLLGIDHAPALAGSRLIGEEFAVQIANPLASTIARDGAVAQEQRKWRANFISTYDLKDFEHSLLKRFSVGTAVRWQERVAIGNPFLTGQRLKEKIVATNKSYTSVAQIADNSAIMETQFPDLANPFFGPAELAGDVWLTYRRKIFKNIDWRVQLNVRNAWGNDHDIPVKANPDGTIAVVRIPNETRWTLANTFTF
ncbi:MAG: TonB-dependent receptor plug domain-containing protein [Opitutaceae bacterium]